MAAAVVALHKNREKEEKLDNDVRDQQYIHTLPPENERVMDIEIGSFLNGCVLPNDNSRNTPLH